MKNLFCPKPHTPLGLRFAVQRLIGTPRPVPTGFLALDQWLEGGFPLGSKIVVYCTEKDQEEWKNYFLKRSLHQSPYVKFDKPFSKRHVNICDSSSWNYRLRFLCSSVIVYRRLKCTCDSRLFVWTPQWKKFLKAKYFWELK